MDLSDLVRELQGRYQNATFDATQPCQNCARSARLVEVIDDAANLLSVIPPDKLSGLQTIIQVYLDSNDRFAFKLEENAGRYNNGPQDYFHNHYHETINYVHIEGNTASYNELKNETSCSVCEILLDVLSGRSLKPLSGIDDWLINLCFCNEKGWFLRGIENHQIEATQQEGKITTNILRDTKLVPVLPLTSRLTFELDEKFVDKSRIIRWIDGCDKKHAGSCHSITDPWLQFEHPTEFLLLDVQRLCLSHQSKPCKYVALSYLWGEQDNIVQTTTSTAAQLFKADAFHRDCIDLPETIRNSIDFVASIGQKFLWIDRFCITQVSYPAYVLTNMYSNYARRTTKSINPVRSTRWQPFTPTHTSRSSLTMDPMTPTAYAVFPNALSVVSLLGNPSVLVQPVNLHALSETTRRVSAFASSMRPEDGRCKNTNFHGGSLSSKTTQFGGAALRPNFKNKWNMILASQPHASCLGLMGRPSGGIEIWYRNTATVSFPILKTSSTLSPRS